MAREPADWAALDVGEDVGLLLGWRPRPDHLDGRPVEIAADVRDLLRETAQETLAELGRRRRRPLSGLPALEAGEEYLSVDLADLARPEPAATEPATDLLQVIEAARRDPRFLERGEIEERGFLFYAVTATLPDDEQAAFVREWNPKRGLGTGRFWTAYGNTLSRIVDPVLVFDQGPVDLVVTGREVAVLRTTAFDRLFADLELATERVPQSLQKVLEALPFAVPEATQALIVEAAQSRRSLANQLRRLSSVDHLHLVTPTAMRGKLRQHDLPEDLFGTGEELALAGADDVPRLLDMLDQRYFEADFSGEHRRADRFSRRP